MAKWLSTEKEWMINNYQQHTVKEMAVYLGRAYPSVRAMASKLRLIKDEDTLSKIYARPNSGQFQKGILPLRQQLIQKAPKVQAPIKNEKKISSAINRPSSKIKVSVRMIKPADTTHLVAVRIDHKTIIYAKPGQDPEEVKQRYLYNRKTAV